MPAVDVDLLQYPASATWAVDDRDATLSASDGNITHVVRATGGWMTATGATALEVQEGLPDFDPSWRLNPIGHVDMSLTLSTTTPTTVNSVTMSN